MALFACVYRSHAHSHQSHVTVTTPTPSLFLPPSLSVLTHPHVRTWAHVLSAHMQRAPESLTIKYHTTCQKRTVHKSAAVFSQMLFVYCFVSDEEDGTSAANGGHRIPRSLGEQSPPPSFCSSTVLLRTLLFCYTVNVNLLCRHRVFCSHEASLDLKKKKKAQSHVPFPQK